MLSHKFLRYIPERFQQGIISRFFYPVKGRWHDIFHAAPLKYAPGVKMKLVPSDYMHTLIAFTGVFEVALTKHMVAAAGRGGTLVDIGANAGYFSLIWAALNSKNISHAFEPSPRNIEILKDNVNLNGLEKRINVYPFGLGRRNGSRNFDPGPVEQTGWGGWTRRKGLGIFQVEERRLDELFDKYSKIDMMKIDVEGADTWVLQGAEKLLLNKCVKEIFFEQNKPRLKLLNIDENEAAHYLRSVGYEVFPITEKTREVVEWKAVPE